MEALSYLSTRPPCLNEGLVSSNDDGGPFGDGYGVGGLLPRGKYD